MKRYWRLCGVYILFSYLLMQIQVTGSDLMAVTTDRLFAGGEIELGRFMVPFIWLMIGGGISAYVISLSKNTLCINIQTDLRGRLVNHLVKLPYHFYDKEGTGTLMNKLISDIYQTETLYSEALPEFMVGIIMVITACVYIGGKNIRLLLATIICYPLLLWLAGKTTRNAGEIAKVRRQLYDKLGSVSYDVLQGILVGRSYNLYELHKNRIFRITDDIVDNERTRTKILGINQVMGDLVRWLPKLFCYMFCLYEVRGGRLTVGVMLAYVMLLDEIAYQMGSIPHYVVTIRECNISLKRLQKIFEEPQEYSGTGKFENDCKNIIELENICFGYSGEYAILKDVSMSVRKGSNIALVGHSGGGKSSVIKLLCGFYQPQGGSYKLYGHDFKEWDIQVLRSQIALVSQNVFLFPVSVAKNVGFGKLDATREEIVEACKRANIHRFIEGLPDGYDTVVGERGTKLSGGQKQRLSIARAILKDAPILLLDEPTSAVDVDTEQEIQEALQEISANRTVITVAHRLSTIVGADEIYVFDQGRIVEKGNHEDLLKGGGVYAALYQKEAKIDEAVKGGEENGILGFSS